MMHASLVGPRGYIAISYAWGDVEDKCLVTLDGLEFPMTRSLWGALQCLRSGSFAVIVWSDAICINQQNSDERGVQVRKMTSIYSNAYEVAIWLGRKEDDSDAAIDLMCSFVEWGHSETIIKDIITSPERTWQFHALVELFQRDYWDRLWCLQEVQNAKKVMVYCGLRATPWETYIGFQEVLRRYHSL